MMGQLVLSKEESEQLLAVLLGSKNLHQGELLTIEMSWVMGSKPLLVKCIRTVQPRILPYDVLADLERSPYLPKFEDS